MGSGSIVRTSKNANLRKDPGLNAPLVQRLNRHQEVQILDTVIVGNETWVRVSVRNGLLERVF